MFGPKVLGEYTSKYSGKLTVNQVWPERYVSTGYWTQTGGIIKDVWRPVFKKLHPPKHKTWLVLGLAAGTVCRLIPDPAKIVGVEIDPVMLDIGKKYFSLSKIKNLEIVNSDTQKYLKTHKFIFDYVLVDMYFGDQIPKFVYTAPFPGKFVVFNHLFYSNIQKHRALSFVEKLKTRYSRVQTVRSITNLLIICT